MKTFSYRVGQQVYTVEAEKADETLLVIVDGQEFKVSPLKTESAELSFVANERVVRAYFAADKNRRWVWVNGSTFVFELGTANKGPDRRASAQSEMGDRLIVAPMPGQVREIQVAEGSEVEKGQTLLLLEAMKMEIRIQAPRAGRLTKLFVQAGQTVERDQVLGEIG